MRRIVDQATLRLHDVEAKHAALTDELQRVRFEHAAASRAVSATTGPGADVGSLAGLIARREALALLLSDLEKRYDESQRALHAAQHQLAAAQADFRNRVAATERQARDAEAEAAALAEAVRRTEHDLAILKTRQSEAAQRACRLRYELASAGEEAPCACPAQEASL